MTVSPACHISVRVLRRGGMCRRLFVVDVGILRLSSSGEGGAFCCGRGLFRPAPRGQDKTQPTLLAGRGRKVSRLLRRWPCGGSGV